MKTEKKKIVFIINPISGTQGKEQILKCLKEKLDKEKYIPEIIYTERAGHAIEIAARKAEEKVFAVVAIGGDGTINEIARSLVHTDTALGIIPCGSGNGLARHLEIPMDVKRAIEIINQGVTDIIDYGMINENPFFCTCGVGFDAFVSMKFAEAGKRGPLTYVEKTLKEGVKYQPETYEIEIDGSKVRYDAFLIACGNASQYGNNAYITPQATLTDGLLDVTIMQPFPIIEAPSIWFSLFNKTLDQNSHIKSFRCSSLRINRSKPGVAHYDGDPIMMGETIDVKIVKQGLTVIVPHEKQISVLLKAQYYLNEIDSLMDDLVMRNKIIIKKGQRKVKKILSN
ncbi:MAG: diacylglycerol kinase family lipid kinase [Mediterranea massiliensis]|nr:diacylglycerol kinase family lipid kinase [Mediterranea massiliensis]